MLRSRTLARRGAVGLTAGLVAVLGALPATAQDHDHDGPTMADEPASFTSMFSVPASSDEVPDGAGEPGATGAFDLRFDAASDTICFDIELDGVTPPYESPANTATHIHEGPVGEAGPPRVVFPDPVMHDDGTLTSSGCITGPFMTGIGPDDGGDHGDGFTVADLEADPQAYYVDTHTTEYPDGAVRGQFPAQSMPMGGMDTGDGSATATIATAGVTTAGATTVDTVAAGVLGLLLLSGVAGLVAVRVRGRVE